MTMTLLDSLVVLGEATTIALLKVGTLRLAGTFKGREAEVIAGLAEGDWDERTD